MDTRLMVRSVFSTLTAALFLSAQSAEGELPLSYRITGMSDSEVIRLTKLQLDRALCGETLDGLYTLAVGRSSLVLPMIRTKIEEILKASPPVTCSTGKNVNTERSIVVLWGKITEAGNLQSLQESSKLLKIDEKRFDEMVAFTMNSIHGNAFTVAYQGFEIGDPAIDKRLVAWLERVLDAELPHLGNPIYDNVTISPRRRWAEAFVDRYGAAPTPAQWSKDPIASRLKPALGVLRGDVNRFAAETAQKRARKQ